MVNLFVKSLITGIKVSGGKMKNTFDPIQIAQGWNKVYDVSLPNIGAVITSPGWTKPVTLNDRVFEIIGSEAYRLGLSFVPHDLNLAKRAVLIGQNVGGSPVIWKRGIDQIAQSGSELVVERLLTPLQKVSLMHLMTSNHALDAPPLTHLGRHLRSGTTSTMLNLTELSSCLALISTPSSDMQPNTSLVFRESLRHGENGSWTITPMQQQRVSLT